ncbi:PHD finger protein ING1-like isoform X3 [Benincasa hispida]|uniref:PHD finger protein ING1-like isoform X3 n=1 Tax=Benincasa hispida TaxID=102211 RepID=UPI0019007D2B|nr:PHD finger protein ING1-like isoform X3 [Benincasa hispida]
MSFLEEFQANLESIPNILQKKYALLRDLDQSLQGLVKQNEQRCEQEIEDIKRGVKCGNITPDTSLIRFSDEALDEQKHSIRIADEKVALAVQAYDLVDTHIQQLDQYLKNFDEKLRQERGSAAATGLPTSSVDGNTKSGRGTEGGREEMAKLRLQLLLQKHQLLQLPQEWNLNYQLIQTNQLTVYATKLVTGRWLPVITLIARLNGFILAVLV